MTITINGTFITGNSASDSITSGKSLGKGANQVGISNLTPYTVDFQHGGKINFGASIADNTLMGGTGNTTIIAGTDKHSINGDNTISVGVGIDASVVKLVRNSITAGNGDNSITVAGPSQNKITLGNGDNIVNINAKGKDSITLGIGVNTLSAQNGAVVTVAAVKNAGDTLDLASGATLHATITDNWLASPASYNNGGTAFLISKGYSVDLALATGSAGWSVTDISRNRVTLTGGSQNDTLAAGKGIDTLIDNGGHDEFIGGSRADTFQINSGVATIENFKVAGDNLIVLSGAAATVMVTKSWKAETNTVDEGALSLIAAKKISINIARASSAVGITLDGSAGGDKLTGGPNADVFWAGKGDTLILGSATDTLYFTKDFSGVKSGAMVTVEHYQAGDTIYYLDSLDAHAGVNLTAGGSDSAVNVNASGIAFFQTPPPSLRTALTELTAAFDSNGNSDVNGNFAFFNVRHAEYLFISGGGETAPSADDTLIKFTGVKIIDGVTLTGNHLNFTFG